MMDIIGINHVIPGLAGQPSQTPMSSSTPARSVPEGSSGSVRVTDQGKAFTGQGARNLEQVMRVSVEKLDEFIRPCVASLQFSVVKDLGKVVVKRMNSETKEIIKQIPSGEVLAMTRVLGKVSGLFVQQQASGWLKHFARAR